MKNKIAIKMILGLLCFVILFHLGIIIKVIPYKIAWGGRLQNDGEMYVFETISIILNLFLGFIILMKGRFIKSYFNQKIVNFILWFFLVLFILNTIGNLFAKTDFEKMFSVLTFLFAVFIGIILKDETKISKSEYL